MWVHSKSHSLMAFVGFLSRQGRLATCPEWIVWVGLRLRKFKENKTKFTQQGRFFILKCHFVILKSHTAAFLLAFSALGWIVATCADGWLPPRILPRWLPRPSAAPRRHQGGGLSTVITACPCCVTTVTQQQDNRHTTVEQLSHNSRTAATDVVRAKTKGQYEDRVVTLKKNNTFLLKSNYDWTRDL